MGTWSLAQDVENPKVVIKHGVTGEWGTPSQAGGVAPQLSEVTCSESGSGCGCPQQLIASSSTLHTQTRLIWDQQMSKPISGQVSGVNPN